MKSVDELDAVRNPLKKTEVKYDSQGGQAKSLLVKKQLLRSTQKLGKSLLFTLQARDCLSALNDSRGGVMNIRLTSQQRDMLIKVKEHFKWKKDLDFEEQSVHIVLKGLEEDDAIDLREIFSDYLLEVGFDDEYVANEEGRVLEELVDKLYIE